MPQLNKGGRFVFGLSVIHENRSVQIPPQAINEYRLSNENKIIIFTGRKITGGFCVTSYPLLSSSKLSHATYHRSESRHNHFVHYSPQNYR